MPRRAARPCRTRTCPGLAGPGGYCATCQKERYRLQNARRPSSAARGYGHRWRRLRRMYLRANPYCVACKRQGRIELATEMDHIIPKAQGGGDMEDNLQAMCKSCHSRKTAREVWHGGGKHAI